jgi:hypothetical protein
MNDIQAPMPNDDELKPLYGQLDGYRGFFHALAAEAAAAAIPATITWRLPVEKAGTRTELATPRLLDFELHKADPFALRKRYPRQKNIQGLYFFASTGEHVWHESELEAHVMRRYDMRGDVVAIAAQPFRIDFGDGAHHIPDLLLYLADHRQVVVDVKAAKFLPDAMTQFEKTHAVCKAVGWEYDIHWEASRQVTVNVDRLSYFKNPGYYPDEEQLQRMLAWLTEPRPLLQAAIALDRPTVPDGRSAILHLVWAGVLTLDLSKPITDTTLIGKANA